jgi:hypothetical protein
MAAYQSSSTHTRHHPWAHWRRGHIVCRELEILKCDEDSKDVFTEAQHALSDVVAGSPLERFVEIDAILGVCPQLEAFGVLASNEVKTCVTLVRDEALDIVVG